MILPIIQAATLKVRLVTPLLDEKKVNSDERAGKNHGRVSEVIIPNINTSKQ